MSEGKTRTFRCVRIPECCILGVGKRTNVEIFLQSSDYSQVWLSVSPTKLKKKKTVSLEFCLPTSDWAHKDRINCPMPQNSTRVKCTNCKPEVIKTVTSLFFISDLVSKSRAVLAVVFPRWYGLCNLESRDYGDLKGFLLLCL